MSRIGKAPIEIPAGVEFKVSDKNLVTVKGPLGELEQAIDSSIKVAQEENVIVLTRETEQKRHKSMHGLYRSLISNMVDGVSKGYTTILELEGVGYRATVKGQQLEMSLGFSHLVLFELPTQVKAEAVSERGKAPTVTLKSYDKQLLGQVVAKIRSLRKIEPYKGKGIRFQGEQIRRKAGKTASA